MASDYWHLERFFRIAGAGDEELPFSAEPFVIGPVVTMREPVWRSARATLLAHGGSDVFDSWSWEQPLAPAAVEELGDSLAPVLAALDGGADVRFADDLRVEDRPDPAAVVTVLKALGLLLRKAVAENAAVETWVT